MTLESLALLPKLEKLPTTDVDVDFEIQPLLTRMGEMDRDLWSIEFSTAVERPLLSLFKEFNVADDVREAYSLGSPSVDENLHERYAEMLERGPQSVTGFMNNLKGKLGELRTKEMLEDLNPDYQYDVAPVLNQPFWDIQEIDPDGVVSNVIQVKIGAESYASEVIERMENAPSVSFALSQEVFKKVSETRPDLLPQAMNTQISSLAMEAEISENIATLARNHGIDIPDSVGEMLPFVGEVVLGIRLIMDIVSTEREYKEVELDDRAKVHALKALTLMSRFGITAVCTTAGGAAGTIAAPGVGSAAGAVAGGGLSYYLNRRLRPRMLEVATRITGVDEDDLFYLRNKAAIDGIGASLAETKAA